VEIEDAQGRVSLRYVPCADPDVEGAERLDMMQLSPESLVVPDVGLVRCLLPLVSPPPPQQAALHTRRSFLLLALLKGGGPRQRRRVMIAEPG
jgi:hypothetical protein